MSKMFKYRGNGKFILVEADGDVDIEQPEETSDIDAAVTQINNLFASSGMTANEYLELMKNIIKWGASNTPPITFNNELKTFIEPISDEQPATDTTPPAEPTSVEQPVSAVPSEPELPKPQVASARKKEKKQKAAPPQQSQDQQVPVTPPEPEVQKTSNKYVIKNLDDLKDSPIREELVNLSSLSDDQLSQKLTELNLLESKLEKVGPYRFAPMGDGKCSLIFPTKTRLVKDINYFTLLFEIDKDAEKYDVKKLPVLRAKYQPGFLREDLVIKGDAKAVEQISPQTKSEPIAEPESKPSSPPQKAQPIPPEEQVTLTNEQEEYYDKNIKNDMAINSMYNSYVSHTRGERITPASKKALFRNYLDFSGDAIPKKYIPKKEPPAKKGRTAKKEPSVEDIPNKDSLKSNFRDYIRDLAQGRTPEPKQPGVYTAEQLKNSDLRKDLIDLCMLEESTLIEQLNKKGIKTGEVQNIGDFRIVPFSDSGGLVFPRGKVLKYNQRYLSKFFMTIEDENEEYKNYQVTNLPVFKGDLNKITLDVRTDLTRYIIPGTLIPIKESKVTKQLERPKQVSISLTDEQQKFFDDKIDGDADINAEYVKYLDKYGASKTLKDIFGLFLKTYGMEDTFEFGYDKIDFINFMSSKKSITENFVHKQTPKLKITIKLGK